MTTTIADIRRMAREAVEAELGDEFFELEPDELDHILRSEEEYLIGICEDFCSERAGPRNLLPCPQGQGLAPRRTGGAAGVRLCGTASASPPLRPALRRGRAGIASPVARDEALPRAEGMAVRGASAVDDPGATAFDRYLYIVGNATLSLRLDHDNPHIQ
jgi:hypothetical protein